MRVERTRIKDKHFQGYFQALQDITRASTCRAQRPWKCGRRTEDFCGSSAAKYVDRNAAGLDSILTYSQVTSKNGDNLWRNYAVDQFKQNQHVQDPAKAAQLRRAAADYKNMLANMIERQVRTICAKRD